MRVLASVAAVSMLSACSEGSGIVPQLYDACFRLDECVQAATLCEELAVEFSGIEYVNSICTTECASEGPLSRDCSRALIGRFGSCYPSRVAGGPDDTLVCFEPCDDDDSCLLGFRCLGAVDLCGGDLTSCPVDPADAICVPGPG